MLIIVNKMIHCDNVNVKAVEYLSEICSKRIFRFHISSDFILMKQNDLYNKNDLPNPISYYGLSKLKWKRY